LWLKKNDLFFLDAGVDVQLLEPTPCRAIQRIARTRWAETDLLHRDQVRAAGIEHRAHGIFALVVVQREPAGDDPPRVGVHERPTTLLRGVDAEHKH